MGMISAVLVFTLFSFYPQYVNWYDFVYKICEALPCGNFERMHYLPDPKLGLIFTPLPQDAFWYVYTLVCVCLCVSLETEWNI